MRRKLVLMVAVYIMLCLSFGTVQASTTISLQPQSPSVTLGDQIVIDVVLSTDLSFLSGALDFTFETELASFSSFSFGSAVDSDFSFSPDTSVAGQINNFGFANFSGINGANIVLAKITFDAIGTGTADFASTVDQSFEGGWFIEGSTEPINDFSTFILTPTSVEINAVPIPGAVWLLGSGLIGLVAMKRRKKN
jgi:hypothetical protein